MQIALCILTRNERQCAEHMLPKLGLPGPSSGYDAWYGIDGGSTDGTIELFQRYKIPMLGQSKRGRGHAFQIAFEEINADAYIFFSPDGNEDPADLVKFRPLLEEGNDLVIASRMMKGAHNEEDGQTLRLRKWANNTFNLMANVSFRRTGPFVSDSINGFRAITREAARKLALDAPDYTIEFQMTIRAFKVRMRIAEFPTYEGDRIAGKSQAKSIPTGLRFLKAFAREWQR